MTGKATAAPPSEVAPATIDPKTMVMDMYLGKMRVKAGSQKQRMKATATSKLGTQAKQ
jgi:hypothetical protein